MNLDPSSPSIDSPTALPAANAAAAREIPQAAQAGWWHRIGGGSLTISLVLHAVVILLALIIVYQISVPAKESVDFLPGGGGGGKGSESAIAKKQRAASLSAPRTRTVSLATNAEIGLPDISSQVSDFSTLAAAVPMGGGLGGGTGGLQGKGSGGLMGNGIGTGFGPGKGGGFISLPKLFGTDIDAKRMAVVLDMSGSMYAFLPLVIKEVDKVAPGSIVILHYGCGLTDREIKQPKIESTSEKEFDTDRISTALSQASTETISADNRDRLLALVKKRQKTYFVPTSDVGSTWVALTDSRLKDADAIYWFADFADTLNQDRIEDLGRKLRGRKQKLYIHPSNPNWLTPGDPLASSVARLERELVTPSGGRVIKQTLVKDTPVTTPPDQQKRANATKS